MSAQADPFDPGPTIGVVGGGASGVLAACALVRSGPAAAITLIDPHPGRGVAYGGSEPRHLLNTRACNMSLDPTDPQGFVDWLNARGAGGRAWAGDDFAPRMIFGDYLQDALAGVVHGPARVELLRERAARIRFEDGRWRVTLRHGGVRAFDVVVLATGNAPPRPLAFPGCEAARPFTIDNPWDGPAIEAVPAAGLALLVGTGLTAVDVAVSLLKRDFGPAVLAVSRRGLRPRVHDRPHDDPPTFAPPYPTTAHGLYRRVRKAAEALAGDDPLARHRIFLGLKPAVPAIWAGLPVVEKRRFLRHLRAWWEVERHRLAPEIAAILQRGETQGRFRSTRGRIVDCRPLPEGDGVQVDLAAGDARWSVRASRIVNCTGPDQDLGRSRDPLIAGLIEDGAGLDSVRLGFDVDDAGAVRRARGAAWRGLYALGSLTRGSFFEITAVPEIREQAERLAREIAARYAPGVARCDAGGAIVRETIGSSARRD